MQFLDRIKSVFMSGTKSVGIMRNTLRRSANLNWGAKQFLDANQISLYVNRAIAMRASKVGEIDFKLTRGDKEIENDKMFFLLYKPNTYQTGTEFWELYQKYKDLTGSVYIWKERSERFGETVPKALHLLRPDRMAPVVDSGEIVRYEYTKPGGGKMTFTPDEILYSYYADPLNPFLGVSLLKAATMEIDTGVQITQYQNSVIRNGGRIEGVFNFKQVITSKIQRDELKDSYKNEYADATRSGRPLFLGGDAEYKRLALTPEELGFLSTKALTLEDICIATGVPKVLLASFSDVKFDNADAAHTIFLRETIRPLLRNLTQKLDEFLFVDPNITLDFIDPTPEDIDKKIKIAESGTKNYYMTRNEIRELMNMDPIEGGDEILVPWNMVPSNSVEEITEARIENNPNTQRSFKNFVHPLKDPEIRKLYGTLKSKRMDRLERTFVSAVEKLWREQKARITDGVSPEGKSAKSIRKGLLDESFDYLTEIKLTRTALLPLIRNILENAGIDAVTLMDANNIFRMTPDLENWIDKRADVLGRELTDTTYEKLKNAFTESAGSSENRRELVKRIESVYEGFTTSRAATIARTEVHGAYQEGTYAGYKQTGVPTKIWVSVADADTREAHLHADGMEVLMNEPFIVDGEALEYPGDPNGSAENVINCRCTI